MSGSNWFKERWLDDLTVLVICTYCLHTALGLVQEAESHAVTFPHREAEALPANPSICRHSPYQEAVKKVPETMLWASQTGEKLCHFRRREWKKERETDGVEDGESGEDRKTERRNG